MSVDVHEGLLDLIASWSERDEAVDSFWGEDLTPRLDMALLERMLAIPIGQEKSSQTGDLATSLDLWCSREFVRAGFDADAMWPRQEEPFVIDPSVIAAMRKLPKRLSMEGERAIRKVGRHDANLMGSVYTKQVDVGFSTWPSGPELLVSTKTMGSSFGKNSKNRFEEAYGDVKNLRARYPLTAHGFLYLARSTIFNEGNAYPKLCHMLEGLSQTPDVYDAVGLIVVEWEEGDATSVRVLPSEEASPSDELSVEHFYATLIDKMLREAPIERHVRVRELRDGVFLGR